MSNWWEAPWPLSRRVEIARQIKAVAMDPFLDCYAIRPYDDDNTNPQSLTAIVAQNTNWTQVRDTNFHVRVGVENTGSGNANTFAPQLEARINAGTWTPVTTTSGATAGLAIVAGQPTDNATLAAALLTGGTGTYQSAESFYDENGTVTTFTFNNGDFVEWLFSVQLGSGLADTDTVEIRVRDGGNAAALDATVTVTVTVDVPAATFVSTEDGPNIPRAYLGDPQVTVFA